MRSRPCAAAFLLMLALCLSTAGCASVLVLEPPRETVLDRKVRIYDEIVEVPEVPPLCDAIPSLEKRWIDVDEGVLYCEVEGKGTPLVLISGGPGTSHHGFHPSFSRAAEFAQVIYYDQRGVGKSSRDPSGDSYTLKQAVDDLDRIRAALGVARWVVLGHSYGGLLAQCYALEYPERVLGLILVCAAPGTPLVQLQPSREREFLSREEVARITAIHRQPDISLQQASYNAHLNGDWKRQSYFRPTEAQLARMARYEWTPGPGFRDRIQRDLNFIDLEGRFSDFTLPTLLIESRWDLTWNTDKPQAFKENHPHGRLVLFEHSGHSPFDDEPDRFFSLLAEFLAQAEECRPLSRAPAGKILWPSPLVWEIESLRPEGSGDRALELLAVAERESLAVSQRWVWLGCCLFGDKHYAEALTAFERVPGLPKPRSCDVFESYVWQGHVLDLLGRREEAVHAYRKALAHLDERRLSTYDQWGMEVNEWWVARRLTTPFVRSDTAQKVLALPWTGAGEEARQLFAQVQQEGLNSGSVLLKLGLALYDGAYYAESLAVFQRLSDQRSIRSTGLVWQGHILDLTGHREAALACYREAKELGIPYPMRHDQYDIVIDEQWIEARLKTPFERK